jgi:hypothetical protein
MIDCITDNYTSIQATFVMLMMNWQLHHESTMIVLSVYEVKKKKIKKKKNIAYLKCCFIFTYHKSLNFNLGKRHHLI